MTYVLQVKAVSQAGKGKAKAGLRQQQQQLKKVAVEQFSPLACNLHTQHNTTQHHEGGEEAGSREEEELS